MGSSSDCSLAFCVRLKDLFQLVLPSDSRYSLRAYG